MISYGDLYEVLRKEKFSENLQLLPKNVLTEISEYINEKKADAIKEDDLLAESGAKAKKQLENFVAIFRELMLRRKKKLLTLVFVAAETGIMKRDYENMLPFERDLFEKLVKAFEDSDKEMSKTLSAKKHEEALKNRMVIFHQGVEQFVDMLGNNVGPFTSGELANLDVEVASILVSSGKASFVDES